MTIEQQIYAYKQLKENNQAFFIDTHEEADRIIEALEKRIPKKPKELGMDEKTHYKCPECGWIPLTIYSDGCYLGNKPKYCERCGQAIDWNEVD